MKAIVTILFVLFFGLLANAQDKGEQKVDTIEMGLVQLTEVAAPAAAAPAAATEEVARLYRRKDSRVKKELTFATKKHYQMA